MADGVGVVRGVYEAFSKGGVQTGLGPMDDNVEWNEAEHFTYWPGRPAVGPRADHRRHAPELSESQP